MKARRWVLWLCGLLFLLIGIIVVWTNVLRHPSPIHYENFEKIQAGMTLFEVEVLLGCPPGDYASGPIQVKMKWHDGTFGFLDIPNWERKVVNLPESLNAWVDDRGEIIIYFNGDGEVRDKKIYPGRRVPSAWWLFIERKLGIEP